MGYAAGPRLAVMAGIHPNEVAGIEAVLQLAGRLDPREIRGTVTLLPVVNQPGFQSRTETICPVDGKNLNFTFPGRATGTFSEALCQSLLEEWAGNADCLVDLHGGDLREEMARFVAWQPVGEAEFDARQLALARAFDAEFLVQLDKSCLTPPGRSVSARAACRRHGVFAEAGSHGILASRDVEFHRDGIINLMATMGMVEQPPVVHQPRPIGDYRFLEAPCDGWNRSQVAAGQLVSADQVLSQLVDQHGHSLATINAPASGYILWRITHPIVRGGDPIVGFGIPLD